MQKPPTCSSGPSSTNSCCFITSIAISMAFPMGVTGLPACIVTSDVLDNVTGNLAVGHYDRDVILCMDFLDDTSYTRSFVGKNQIPA